MSTASKYDRKGAPKKGDRPYLVKFGAHVRELREKLNIDQATLGKRCERTQVWVSKIENGIVELGLNDLPTLAKALRTTAKEPLP